VAFQKGTSGNPKGRPRRSDSERALRQRISEHAPGIIDRLLTASEQGDTTASKLLLERVLPVIRPVDMPVKLTAGKDADLTEVGRAALLSMAAGDLTPNQTREILTGISSLARIAETDELIRRIEALEAATDGKVTG
jgi:hypothetical protein